MRGITICLFMLYIFYLQNASKYISLSVWDFFLPKILVGMHLSSDSWGWAGGKQP